MKAGDRFGAFEIVAPIGAGGMGEVYRASDSNLKRSVAIKVLPAAVAGDADRLARFQREAEVLAALNHPNIAAIYGLEKTPDFTALVMELVEGEDLSELILGSRGRQTPGLHLIDALPIAKQIADALEAAHEQGIVHRDLKPANIKVRADGTVKVLDFGLAKALDPGPIDPGLHSNQANSPTMTSPAMTAMGMILGTAAYMSPEQAKGKPVDKRADIWAFGVVLCEMLTGRRLFDAEDVSETLAAVLTRDVALTSLPSTIPPRLRALVRDCLIRDPKQRLRDIGDARIALDKIITGAPEDAVAPSSSPRAPALPWIVAGTLTAALGVALWAPWRVEQPVDRPLLRLDVDLGADAILPWAALSNSNSIALSPDGTRLAYTAGTPRRLFTRRLDQPKASELPGTQDATWPFFSHDGHWIGFSVSGKVTKISVEGGAVVPLGDVTGFSGASWAEDGSIVMSDAAGKGLLQLSAAGDSLKALAPPGSNGEILVVPQLLPGGKAILFAACGTGGPDTCNIEVLTLADDRRTVLVQGGHSPHYLSSLNGTGHLVYLNRATLFAVPFDLATLSTRGTAVPMLNDVAFGLTRGTGHFDASRTGTLIYRKSRVDAEALATIQWLDPNGKKTPLRSKPTIYGNSNPTFSPDGTRLALAIRQGGSEDVWVYDLQRDAITRLTFGGVNNYPVWSHDGQYIVFSKPFQGMSQVRADGASPPQPLTESTTIQIPGSFTPDGKWLAYYTTTPRYQVLTVPLEAQGGQLKAGKAEQFLESNFQDSRPSFSPDGRWLAYVSNESGRDEVYVRPFPLPSSGQGGKWPVSNNGAGAPHWSRAGHALLYRSGDQVMTVSYSVKGDTFVAEKPRVWTAALGGPTWDVAPDGKRVAVVIAETAGQAPEQEHGIVMLLNFADELRRRVPGKK